LFLSCEADISAPGGTTRLDTLTAEQVDDHAHMLRGTSTTFTMELQPMWVDCQEAVARIVAANLLRNAAENS
jgi:hypothetical protein